MAMTARDLDKAVANGVDLSDGDFRDTNFAAVATLLGGKFARCDFTGCDLNGVDLSGADFTGAKLVDVSMVECDLRDANFTDADLTGVCLMDAQTDERGLTFANAKGIHDAGFDDRGYRFIGVKQSDGSIYVKAGCRWYTTPQALEHWGPDCNDNEDAIERVDAIIAALST